MKKYLFTGLIILLPAVLTLMLIVFLFHFFTAPLAPFVNDLLYFLQMHLAFSMPLSLQIFISRLIALILACIFILLLGMVARWFVVRSLIHGMHSVLTRIPFIKTIFKVSRDVFSALFSQEGKKAFKFPVMIPFPDYPNHSIGFVVGEVPHECQDKIKSPLVAVFTPTAPHPISGFLLIVEKKDALPIDMSNEDVIKFLVSCGMIVPDDKP